MIAALAASTYAFSGPAQPLADSLAARVVQKDGLTHVPLIRRAKTVQEHAAMKAWRAQASAKNSTIMIKNFQVFPLSRLPCELPLHSTPLLSRDLPLQS